jgi:hypothetical protein
MNRGNQRQPSPAIPTVFAALRCSVRLSYRNCTGVAGSRYSLSIAQRPLRPLSPACRLPERRPRLGAAGACGRASPWDRSIRPQDRPSAVPIGGRTLPRAGITALPVGGLLTPRGQCFLRHSGQPLSLTSQPAREGVRRADGLSRLPGLRCSTLHGSHLPSVISVVGGSPRDRYSWGLLSVVVLCRPSTTVPRSGSPQNPAQNGRSSGLSPLSALVSLYRASSPTNSREARACRASALLSSRLVFAFLGTSRELPRFFLG